MALKKRKVKKNLWMPFCEVQQGNYKLVYKENKPIGLEYVKVTMKNLFDTEHFHIPEDGFIFGNHKDQMFFIPAKRVK